MFDGDKRAIVSGRVEAKLEMKVPRAVKKSAVSVTKITAARYRRRDDGLTLLVIYLAPKPVEIIATVLSKIKTSSQKEK